jgi:hypothetical protein
LVPFLPLTNRIDGCRPAFAHRYARWCSGDNAVERYALFLTSLALSTDLTERRTALQRTREHGLDIPWVAIVTAEHTIECSLDNLPPSGDHYRIRRRQCSTQRKRQRYYLFNRSSGRRSSRQTRTTRRWNRRILSRDTCSVRTASLVVFLLLPCFTALIFVCVMLARGRINVARLLLDMLQP